LKKDLKIAIEVRAILDLVKQFAPGKSVELRIPLYGVVQCVKGVNHRRGTPPNTVEMKAQILIKLCRQPEKWADFVAEGHISISGVSADLSQIFSQVSKRYFLGME
jgi:hypothetical protein